MRKLLAVCLLAMMAILAAGPAAAQTFGGMDFIKTGSQSWTDPNAWVEREFGQYDPFWPENTLGTYHVPDATNGANIRNGATVAFNDGSTQYASNVAVGGTGEGIWDPNFLGDPNSYPFGYISRPASTLNISGAATTLVVDPNGTSNSVSAGVFYNGTINQSGGSVNTAWLRIGEGVGASGYYNLSGGTMIARYRMNVGYAAGRTGWTGAGVTEAGGGYGEVTMTDGYLQTGTSSGLNLGLARTNIAGLDPNGLAVNLLASGSGKMTLSGGVVVIPGSGTDLNLGYGGSPANPWEDPNLATTWVQSKGTLIMTGGSIAVVDDVRVGLLTGTGIYAGGEGILEATGGTLECDQFLIGSTTLASMKGPGGTGTVRVGPNAYIYARNTGSTSVNFDDDGGDRNNLIIDVTNTGAGKIVSAGTCAIGTNNTALDMNAISFRPKQGDLYVVLDGVTAGSGSFSRITSNITHGLDPNYVDANSNPVAFTGAWNTADYEVVFRGFTAGDAAGDGDVDLVDLGVLGGNWNKTGQTWSQGDFSGDGVVGLLDLGALAANWNWVKPAGAPVPEPATLSLLGLGALALIRRKRS